MAFPASAASPFVVSQTPLEVARAALKAGTAKALGTAQFPLGRATSHQDAAALSLGNPALDALLPDGGLSWGQVIELCVAQPSYATSISLLACARAQQEGLQATGAMPWCAFFDPFASLYAPGAAQAGVNLERLLVIRPPLDALARLAVRVVEARAFALIVVDTFSFTGDPVAKGAGKGVAQINLAKWANVVRRLNGVVANTHSSVLLITDKNAYRPLPLPVALRLDLSCNSPGLLKAEIAKEKYGRISQSRTIAVHDFVPGCAYSNGEHSSWTTDPDHAEQMLVPSLAVASMTGRSR